MDQKADFVLIPRPARFGEDGRPWPVCPCGACQSTTPAWLGWRTCPCGGASGEVCSTGTPHWIVFERALIERRRVARQERLEADRADRVRGRITDLRTKR